MTTRRPQDTLVDILPIVTGAFAFPTHGIKDIAKRLGFKWRHDCMVSNVLRICT